MLGLGQFGCSGQADRTSRPGAQLRAPERTGLGLGQYLKQMSIAAAEAAKDKVVYQS